MCQIRTKLLGLFILVWVLGGHCAAQTPVPAVPVVEKYAVVFGQRIHYVEAGSGPTLLLLHGLGDSLEVWRAEIPALARSYHVIAIDQIGSGLSDKPMLSYRPQTLVDFLDEFMRVRGLRTATLVGNSLGGWVAALMSIEHPERVDALVLVDSGGLAALNKVLGARLLNALRMSSIEDLRLLFQLGDPLDHASEKDLRSAFAERVSAGDGYTVSQLVDSIERGDDMLDGRLGRIRCPTLIVWGREDELIPLRFGVQLHHDIHGSQLTVLEHCGHEPQLGCPSAFEKVLESYLRSRMRTPNSVKPH